MRRRVEYELRLERVADALAPREFEWGFTSRVYLTAHFNRVPVDVRLKENDAVTVTISGELPVEAKGKIPATAAIGFQGIVHHYNNNGTDCKTNGGTNHIMLKQFESGSYDKVIPFVMHTTRDKYAKAAVRVTLVTKSIGAGLSFQPMHINANAAGNAINSVIKRTYDMEMAMGDTIPGTNNVRCFIDISEESYEFSGTPVPALAYVKGEIPASNEGFWINALDTVMDNESITKNQFLYKMDKNEQARIAFKLIDYPIQILPYLGDQVDRRSRVKNGGIGKYVYSASLKISYEHFAQILAFMADDCEGSAKGIVTIRRSLGDYMKANGHKKDIHHETLRKIDSILDQYVLLMSLCVVHGAKADDSSDMPKGAHMADVGLPVKYFKECLERTEDGRKLSAKLPWPDHIESGYETMMGEGTAALDPRGFPDPLAHVRAYLHKGKGFAKLKHPMVMGHGTESPFYLGGLQGWTTYFSDRTDGQYGIGAFWFTDARKGTRGSMYTDFTSERKCVGLRPMPTQPPQVQQIMKEVNAFSVPPEPLVLSDEKNAIKSEEIENLQRKINALQRGPGNSSTTLPIYVSPDQMTPELAEELYSDVTSNMKRVWKITYKPQRLTDRYHGYRLDVHLNLDD